MADIPEDLRAELLALHEKIDPDDVDQDDGLETDPHVTVLYGMIDEDLDAVQDVLKSAGKVPCKITGVDVFEKDDKDVLVLRVESDKLTELHDELLAVTDAHQTFSEYKPHITIGYLNKGAAGRYRDLVEGTIGA
jgi:2'-5' RNA ligase